MKFLDQLIEKSKKIKKSLPMHSGDWELLLGIKLSDNFKIISSRVGFDYFGGFEWLSFDGKDINSVIGCTSGFRQDYKLSIDTLVLADDGASYLFMKCFGDHEEFFWISANDFYNFCQGKPLEYDYDHFPTFEAFFEFLLDEEEKMRKEEESEN